MTDLLEQLIREQAPAPRPEFVESLDRRVDQGFAYGPGIDVERDPIWLWEPAVFRMFGAMRARPMRAVAVLMLVALVGGGIFLSPGSMLPHSGDADQAMEGTKQGGSSADTLFADDYQPAPIVGDAPADESSAATSGGGTSTATVSASVIDYRRHILGSGLFLAVPPKQVPEVVADAVEIANDLDGYPGSSSFDVEGDTATGSADLWVPTDRYAETMAQLSRLGEVERTTKESRDVTASRAGLVDEIEANRAMLREIDERSERGEPNPQRDAIALQLQLREQRLANIDRRIDMTLINVKVRGVEPKPAPPAERWSIEWALDTAGDTVGRTAALAIVVGGALLLPAIVAGIVWFGFIARRRRQRDRTLDDE